MKFRMLLACLSCLMSAAVLASDVQESGIESRDIVASDGVRLHARIAGEGPTCLFIHGGPGQGSRSFEQMGGQALQSFVRMVYLDQRGSGASANATDYHLDRMVRDIEEVRRSLGAERVCLVAHSFGGILASEYAFRYPQRVSALVMLNAAVHYHSAYNARMRIEFADRLTGAHSDIPADATLEQLKPLEDAALERLARAGLGYRLLAEDPAVQARMREVDGSYQRTLDFGTNVVRNKATYPEYYRDHSDTTSKVRTPVLVLTGTRDYAVGPEQYRSFRFPRQTVRHVDGGHLMYYERSGEIARHICEFLAQHAVVTDGGKCRDAAR